MHCRGKAKRKKKNKSGKWKDEKIVRVCSWCRWCVVMWLARAFVLFIVTEGGANGYGYAGYAVKLWGAARVWSVQRCIARKLRGRWMRLEWRTHRERIWWGPVRVADCGAPTKTGPDQWLYGAHHRFQASLSRIGWSWRGRET